MPFSLREPLGVGLNDILSMLLDSQREPRTLGICEKIVDRCTVNHIYTYVYNINICVCVCVELCITCLQLFTHIQVYFACWLPVWLDADENNENSKTQIMHYSHT